MHDSLGFLQTLAIVLCVAAVTTVVFQRLKQPVVLGYLLAGMIVGPHVVIPLEADSHTVHTLAELGVILLMFSLGLEFSISKLFSVGVTAGIVAIVQCSLMVWLGYVIGQLFGWSRLESFFAGAIIAISSTTIIVKAFEEQGIRGGFTHVVFGILIVEDLIGILLITILTALSAGEELTAAGYRPHRRPTGGLSCGVADCWAPCRSAVDAGHRQTGPAGNNDRRQRRIGVRFFATGCGAWLLSRPRRVYRGFARRRIRRRKNSRASRATNSRYVRRHLFRVGRHAHRTRANRDKLVGRADVLASGSLR